ncbi:MAG: phosphotransferase family protein [Solirubrobacteraceae bacterium]|nr:phosphotransferase family protein [Solirubrobacteraceae bacterium]
MALLNEIDREVAAARLAAWLAPRVAGGATVRIDAIDVPEASGLSTETLLVDASWTGDDGPQASRLVARVAPRGEGIFPRYDLAREHDVLAALGRLGAVPVPPVVGVEEDPRVLGSPFLVMGRVDGRAAADDPPFTVEGWVLDLPVDRRAALNERALAALAAVHAVDWRSAGLEALDPRRGDESFLDAQLRTWRETFAWASAGEANPTVEDGFAWLDEHRPADEPDPVLAWGDARLGNLLVDDDQQVTAVLDWEMVTVGAPDLDLGWWLFIMRHHTEGIGVPAPAGFPSRDEVVARYRELTGREVRDVDYYEVLAAVRLSVLMHRAGRLMTELGLLPADAPMRLSNPATHLLARLTGRPTPDAASQSFIGNRA